MSEIDFNDIHSLRQTLHLGSVADVQYASNKTLGITDLNISDFSHERETSNNGNSGFEII